MTNRRSGSAAADPVGNAAPPRARGMRPRTTQTISPATPQGAADEHATPSSPPIADPFASLLVESHLPPGGALATDPRDGERPPADPFGETLRPAPASIPTVQADDPHPVEFPVTLTIQSLRADAKVVISLRDDPPAIWSEGHSRGLIGFSLSSLRDPAIYMRTFLVNARDIYLQSYRACQELRCQLFVRTSDTLVRGRVDLPPGTVLTIQTGIDRTSVVGVSSFAVALPQMGAGDGR
ncbi:hypothetical protein ASE86_11205 [Sphingomonas sp. Leaf33]|uniref:hypothetical protein n=1 Tax=Sphingomonas sp. Leaf33 TaxID=1736215 RepID=UPI0006F5D82B|nr:hypothetical protein [Sphingomonas sp. Leaf33]KQN26633.1 hypothetical protein ASE86_11205 [Sphingomonas sp. Leaf33]